MTHRRGWGTTLLVLGLIAITGGLLARFVIYPAQLQFPADVDVTRTYEGELAVMLNPAALETGDLATLFLTDVPVTLERNVQTLETGGADGAIVQEVAVMNGPAGPMLTTEDVYAIDRRTMEAIPNFSDDARVIEREGLVIGFPIGTEQQDYTGWNGDTLETVTLTYVEEAERGGIDTLVFTASSGPEPIVDEALLATLPATLPKALLAQLAPTLGLPAEQAAQFEQLLAGLPDDVPLGYTYAFDKTYWVEPATGVLIDIEVSESRAAVISVPGGPTVPLTEVQQLSYVTTAESVEAAVDDAQSAISDMRLLGLIVPGIAVGLGIVLAGIGLWLLVRREETLATSEPRKEALTP